MASRFRLSRVRRWPLLVLRLLVCGLVVLAVAGPEVEWPGRQSRSALILLDESLSMRSEAIRESVLRKAREEIAALAKEDRVAIAGFDRYPRPLCDFTSDPDLIEQALAAYRPGHTDADFGAALAWADERLRSQPSRRLLTIVSDLQATNVAALRRAELAAELRVVRVDLPEQTNASLNEVAVRSFGGQIEVTSALSLSEGERTEVKPISLKPGPLSVGGATASDANASLSVLPVGEAFIAGRLTTNAAIAFRADDVRFFAARLPAEGTVLIVQPLASTGGHALYVETALRAGLHQISDVNPARVTDRLPGDADSLRRYRAVICPARAIDENNVDAVREYAREGGVIVVTMGVEDGLLPEQLLDGGAAPTLDQRQTAGLLPPVFAGRGMYASYAEVRFRAARGVGAAKGEAVLRYTSGEVAASRIAHGRGALVLLGFGLTDKDTTLVRSALFPDLIEWLIEGARANGVAEFVAGHAPAATLLGGAERLVRIYSADGPPLGQEVAIERRTLDEPGVYKVERASGVTVFAINAPASESRLAQVSEQELLDRVTIKDAAEPSPATGQASEAGGEVGSWWVLAVAALALSLIELACCGAGPKLMGQT